MTQRDKIALQELLIDFGKEIGCCSGDCYNCEFGMIPELAGTIECPLDTVKKMVWLKVNDPDALRGDDWMRDEDRESVIKGLEYIEKAAYGWNINGMTLGKPTEEIENTCAAAIALLKAQEPRVMTPLEVMLAESVWLEDIDKEKVIHGLRCSSGAGRHWFVISDTEAISAMNEDYGVRWRCWTSRPTDAQREATPWNS